MKKRYQVFISSTYTDLIEERKKLQEILLMADCIPAGMEAFVATSDEQFNVIKKVIDLCDYYVLIVGGRYGSVNENTGLSYTEMEYDYAVDKNIPVLVFCLDESVRLSPEKAETDKVKIEKLALFRNKVMENRLASMWKDLSELAGKAAISIMKAKEEIDRPGWIRADTVSAIDNSELLLQINELRIENKKLSNELQEANDKLIQYCSFDKNEIAFDDSPITVSVKGLTNVTKSTNLKELFGVVALQMLTGFASMDTVEKAIVGFAGGREHDKITDSTLSRTIMNQYQALGLVNASLIGFTLTDLGKKVKNDLVLIKKN